MRINKTDEEKKINKTLSYAGCCRMINNIRNAKTLEELYKRCETADAWVKCNTVLSDDEYYRLLGAIYLFAEKAEKKAAQTALR